MGNDQNWSLLKAESSSPTHLRDPILISDGYGFKKLVSGEKGM